MKSPPPDTTEHQVATVRSAAAEALHKQDGAKANPTSTTCPRTRRSGTRGQRGSGTLGGGIMGAPSALAADRDGERITVVPARPRQGTGRPIGTQIRNSVVRPAERYRTVWPPAEPPTITGISGRCERSDRRRLQRMTGCPGGPSQVPERRFGDLRLYAALASPT
jgi:hypothetical protein